MVSEELVAAGRFFDGEAYTVDIAALRTIHPGLRNLEQYLLEAGREDLAELPIPGEGNTWEAS